MRIILLVLFLVLIGSFEFLHAQVVPDSLISHRIRVSLDPADRSVEGFFTAHVLRGELVRVTTDSLTLIVHPAVSPVTVSSNVIRRIDLSRGVNRSRSAARMGLQGAFIWGTLSYPEFEEDALIWAGAGFVVGGIIGAVWPQEAWSRVFRRR